MPRGLGLGFETDDTAGVEVGVGVARQVRDDKKGAVARHEVE